MPHRDLTSLSPEELDALEKDIKAERTRRLEVERRAFLDQAKELAKRHGISLNELFRTPTRQRSGARAKYRNPDNPEDTWSGRGKQPTWVQQQLAAGHTLADFEILAALTDTPDDTAQGRKQSTRQP